MAHLEQRARELLTSSSTSMNSDELSFTDLRDQADNVNAVFAHPKGLKPKLDTIHESQPPKKTLKKYAPSAHHTSSLDKVRSKTNSTPSYLNTEEVLHKQKRSTSKNTIERHAPSHQQQSGYLAGNSCQREKYELKMKVNQLQQKLDLQKKKIKRISGKGKNTENQSPNIV